MQQKTKTVSVRMPAEMYGMLRVLANAEGRSMSKQLIQIIQEWIEFKKRGEVEPEKEFVFEGLDKYINPTVSPYDYTITWPDGKPMDGSGNISTGDVQGNVQGYTGHIISHDVEMAGGVSMGGPGFTNVPQKHTIEFFSDQPLDLGNLIQSGNIKITIEEEDNG